jgi:hypothetical protein
MGIDISMFCWILGIFFPFALANSQKNSHGSSLNIQIYIIQHHTVFLVQTLRMQTTWITSSLQYFTKPTRPITKAEQIGFMAYLPVYCNRRHNWCMFVSFCFCNRFYPIRKGLKTEYHETFRASRVCFHFANPGSGPLGALAGF